MLLGIILGSFGLALVLTLVLCNRLANHKDMKRIEELKKELGYELKKYKRYE